MSDILGAFRQRAEDLIDTINSKGGVRATIDSVRRQMAEADRRRAINRAKDELRRLDAQIAELITAVGVQAVGLHRTNHLNSPELQPLCQHIVELQAAVEQQRAELATLEAKEPAESHDGERQCPKCGHALTTDGSFCPHCGAPLEREAPKFCAHCGAPLRPEARFCAKCGHGTHVTDKTP
jgi:RNA polymerase subunit RPABC4/transcription elongation factor Spt4